MPSTSAGLFFAPLAVEIDSLSQLTREVFGPIVHLVRYPAHKLDAVIDAVNATGYGLTLGMHTRVDATARYIASRVRAGNVYVNRNMIGAVVGVQPFGGRGLSGTGPKAGGPHYLPRFATEQTLTINTAAVGGNASLLTIGESEKKRLGQRGSSDVARSSTRQTLSRSRSSSCGRATQRVRFG